jgi:hypothetical protein
MHFLRCLVVVVAMPLPVGQGFDPSRTVLYWGKGNMKTPSIAILTGVALSLGLMLIGRQVDVAVCAIVLFGTGIVAWTVEQYYQHHGHH